MAPFAFDTPADEMAAIAHRRHHNTRAAKVINLMTDSSRS